MKVQMKKVLATILIGIMVSASFEPIGVHAAEYAKQELIEEGYHYGDIVILLRSGAGRMEPMAEFLEKNGIPVSCENKTGYFHTREITIILNYLSVVDNVYPDGFGHAFFYWRFYRGRTD